MAVCGIPCICLSAAFDAVASHCCKWVGNANHQQRAMLVANRLQEMLLRQLL